MDRVKRRFENRGSKEVGSNYHTRKKVKSKVSKRCGDLDMYGYDVELCSSMMCGWCGKDYMSHEQGYLCDGCRIEFDMWVV